MIVGVSGQTAARRRLPVSLLLLTCALFGVGGWCLVSRALSPSDATTISVGDSPVSSGGVTVTAVADPASPLRVGDRVLLIDGVRLADRITRPPGGPPAAAGQTLRYEIQRDGQHQVVDVTLRPYPVLESLVNGWPTLLVVGLLLITSAAIAWAQPRDPAARAAWLASSIGVPTTLGSTFFSVEALDLVAGHQFWRWFVGEAAFALLWAGMLHFALAFPAVTNPRALGPARSRRRRGRAPPGRPTPGGRSAGRWPTGCSPRAWSACTSVW